MGQNEILENGIEEEIHIRGNDIFGVESFNKIGRSTVRINFSNSYGTGVFIKFMKNEKLFILY
jgi:hypothetical protein